MESKYQTQIEKSDKLSSSDENLFDNEELNTTCNTEQSEVPEIVTNLKELPEVSAAVSEMVNNGPQSEVFKSIFEPGSAEEMEMRKKLFECSYELYWTCKARRQREKEEEEKAPFKDKVLQEDYETTRMVKAVLKQSREKDVLITKSIEECKALIARYYKAIDDFDNHMLTIRDREIRRMVLEGTKEE